MRRLSAAELQAARDVLCSDEGPHVADAMFQVALGQRPPRALESTLADLDWYCDGAPTELGALIRDPLREYGFWLQRARRLPSEDVVAALRARTYADQQVVELGSGAGCNLFSIGLHAAAVVGVEPMPVYSQMGTILAHMEGLPQPEVVEAFARDLPFETARFDRAVCYSAHQYMQLRPALAEASRVVRPGGELILVGNTLWSFWGESILRFGQERSLGTAKYDTFAIVNTLSYQMLSRRVLVGRGGTTTATPIYPSRRYLKRTLGSLGFEWNEDSVHRVSSGESVIIARRS